MGSHQCSGEKKTLPRFLTGCEELLYEEGADDEGGKRAHHGECPEREQLAVRLVVPPVVDGRRQPEQTLATCRRRDELLVMETAASEAGLCTYLGNRRRTLIRDQL